MSRTQASTRPPAGASRLLVLRPRPPFRLDLTAWALRRREQNAIDGWDGRTYRRALVIAQRRIAVAVRQVGGPDAPLLEVAITGRALAPSAQSLATETLTGLLGVDLDLSGFYARAATDRALAPLAERYRGVKPPRFPTLFECMLNAVACQQISLAAGLTVLSRLAAAASRGLGFSERKARTILQLARAAADGELERERCEPLDDADVVRALVQR